MEWYDLQKYPLPRPEQNFEEYLVVVQESHYPTSSYDIIDAPYDREFVTTALFDCDQKIWHLSKSDIVINALFTADDAPLNGMWVSHYMEMPELPHDS